MLYFPQIATGATVQYPVRRSRRTRTLQNICRGGEVVKFFDSNASTTEWDLTFSALTDDEMFTLEQFFVTTEGALGNFTFLDPVGNLLCWSEALDDPAWEKGALITTTGGTCDPFGSLRAWRLTNCAPVALQIAQTLAVPASYCYCISVYIRADANVDVALIRGTERATRSITPRWQRLAFTSQSHSPDNSVRFGLELPGNVNADVFGFQVEAQPSASGYKKSGARTGVYENARFRDDAIRAVRLGPDNNTCKTSVIHGEHF